MKKTMFKSSKLLIVVLAISALIFTGCSCGSKDKKDEKSTQKGVAATIINEDGSVEYVDDVIKNDKSNDKSNVNGSSDEEDVNDLVGSDDSGSKKSNSKKSNSKNSSDKKSGSKSSNSKNSDGKKSNGSSSNSDSKKSDSKKSDSGKKDSDSKSDDKEKTTKKSNFDIDKSDNDSRFGPIIDGKRKK